MSVAATAVAVLATIMSLHMTGLLILPQWAQQNVSLADKIYTRPRSAGEVTPLGVKLRPPTEDSLKAMKVVPYAELVLGSGNRLHKDILLDPRYKQFQHPVTIDMTDHPRQPPTAVWDLEALPLPFPDNTFYEIHAYQVLEHTGKLGDWRFFFEQFEDLWRMLKPNGFLAITVPHHTSPWLFGDPGHTRVITNGTLLFLNQQEYHHRIGRTTMTDYRAYFKGDFQVTWQQDIGEHLYVALKAIKPARTFE